MFAYRRSNENWHDKVEEMTESEVIDLLKSLEIYSVSDGHHDVGLVISIYDT